jgi:hypothetical protein
MRDAFISLFRAARAVSAVLLVAAASALGGCANSGATSGTGSAFAMAGAGDGATIAFESIDGPPPQVFDRMVGVLDSESKLRSLSIVSREGASTYRVRSYLSAQVVHGKTLIAWVWDVYDRDQQRTLRLSGEEPTGKSGRDAGRDPWAAADDLVLRKIAQAGLSGLSSAINGPSQQRDMPQPAPDKRGPAVADANDSSPNASSLTALSYATDH